MREYRTESYKKKLAGNKFFSSDSDLKKYDGMRVEKVIKELTEKDYDRELLDDTDRNEDGKRRYEINCMYEVKLQNGEIINAYEDEITQIIVAIMKHDEVIISERKNYARKKCARNQSYKRKYLLR